MRQSYTADVERSPRDQEVVSASSTNPAIVISKFELWSYDCEADNWVRLPDTPFGKRAVSVVSVEPLTVICRDGSVLVLHREWSERTPLPGSVPDWQSKNPNSKLF